MRLSQIFGIGRLRELVGNITKASGSSPASRSPPAVLLGIALCEVDARIAWDLAARWPRLFGASAEGARGTHAAIAGSMITAAGVVFSITIVALSLAATAYAPRVLRAFMHERPTQVAFGVRALLQRSRTDAGSVAGAESLSAKSPRFARGQVCRINRSVTR